ncbi:hypothetical protein B0I12_000893 [Microbacterium hydrothermale]|nr:hypothetical protein [Microbacterium hydrothermale]
MGRACARSRCPHNSPIRGRNGREPARRADLQELCGGWHDQGASVVRERRRADPDLRSRCPHNSCNTGQKGAGACAAGRSAGVVRGPGRPGSFGRARATSRGPGLEVALPAQLLQSGAERGRSRRGGLICRSCAGAGTTGELRSCASDVARGPDSRSRCLHNPAIRGRKGREPAWRADLQELCGRHVAQRTQLGAGSCSAEHRRPHAPEGARGRRAERVSRGAAVRCGRRRRRGSSRRRMPPCRRSPRARGRARRGRRAARGRARAPARTRSRRPRRDPS